MENRTVDILINHLLHDTKIEEAYKEELDMINKFTFIAKENREYRDNQYETLKEKDKACELSRDASIYSRLLRNYTDQTRFQQARYKAYARSNKNSTEQQNLLLCQEVMTNIIDLTMNVAKYRENMQYSMDSNELLPDKVWEEYKIIFQLDPICNFDSANHLEDRFNKYCWDTYYSQTIENCEGNMVEYTHQTLEEATFQPNICQCTQVEVSSKHVLGEIIKYLRLVMSPLPPPSTPPPIPSFPIRIMLLGYPYCGKLTQARLLAKAYNLYVISLDNIIDAFMNEKEMELGSIYYETDVQELLQLMKSVLVKGRSIPDDMYVKLVCLYIQHLPQQSYRVNSEDEINNSNEDSEETNTNPSYQGWILCDFPTTNRQAKLLELSLSGFNEDEKIPTSIDSASSITPSIPKCPPDTKALYGKSGIDLVLYMSLKVQETYLRCLGSLRDPETNTTYHMSYNPPPENCTFRHRLQPINNSLSSVEHLSIMSCSFDHEFPEISAFYSQFDVLRTVDASNISKDELFHDLRLQIDVMLHLRKEREEQKEQDKKRIEKEVLELEESRKLELDQLNQIVMECEAKEEEEKQLLLKGEEEKLKKDELNRLQELVNEASQQTKEALDAIDIYHKRIQKEEDKKKRYIPSIDKCIADTLTKQWNHIETQYANGFNTSWSTIRRSRNDLDTYYQRVVLDFSEYLHQPDSREILLIDFQKRFNSISRDMRYEITTREELILSLFELRKNLNELFHKKTMDSEQEIQNLREEKYTEDQIEFNLLGFRSLIQLEFDRFRSSILLLSQIWKAFTTEQLEEFEEKTIKLTLKDAKEPITICILQQNIDELYMNDNEKDAILNKKGKNPSKDSKSQSTEHDDILDVLTHTIGHALTYSQQFYEAMYPNESNDEKIEDDSNTNKEMDNCTISRKTLLQNIQSGIQFEYDLLQQRLKTIQTNCEKTIHSIQIMKSKLFDSLENAIKLRIYHEKSAMKSLFQYIYKRIEDKEYLDYSIELMRPPKYRFPPLLLLSSDTYISIQYDKRVLPEPEPKLPPIVEYVHDIYFSGRQLNDLRKFLRSVALQVSNQIDIIPVFVFNNVILRHFSSKKNVPSKWQKCTTEAIQRLSTYIDKRNVGMICINDFIAALQAQYRIDEFLSIMKVEE